MAPLAINRSSKICETISGMRVGTLILALSLSLVGGCDFNKRSSAFACDTEGSCPEGRVCEMGWCVVSGTPMPDADGPVVDAAVDATVDATVDFCVACAGGTCTNDCTESNCAYDCAVDGCECNFSCGADSMKCNGTCAAGTTCNIDCGMGKQCHPTCEAGSICDIDCTGVKDCKRVKCDGDAVCILNCADTGAMDCKFETCDGVELSCPDNILVCGRDCP